MTAMQRGSLRALREGNRGRLLSLLREHGAMHRAELARRAGVSRTTVSTIVSGLLSDGLVVESPPGELPDALAQAPGTRVSRRDGRAGGLLTLNPSAGLALGIDFSYRHVQVILADLAHQVLAEQARPLRPDQPWAQNLDIAERMIEAVLQAADAPIERVIGAGLGVPGPVDLTRQLVGRSSNSAGWVGSRAADEFSTRLGVPVAMDNTSHLGCLAEAVWGAGAGCPSLLYVKLADGVGGGLVIDGRIYRGAVGAAGEIGHLTIDESGPACRCGNRGCLEAYAAVPAVLDALRPLLGEDVTVADVIAGAHDRLRPVIRVLNDTGQVLGRALASVCNLLNPGRIVIGGELVAAGDALLVPLRETLGRHALQIIAETVEVVPAALGDNAGALGAVALVLRQDGWLTTSAGRR